MGIPGGERRPPAAIFDVDGVLVRGFTMFSFGRRLAREGLIDRASWLRLAADFLGLWSGKTSYARFARDAVEHYGLALAGRKQSDFLAAGQENAGRVRLYWYAPGLIALLRRRGLATVAISGSPEECMRPLTERIGLDESYGSVIATDAAGVYTGAVARNMALGESKAAMVRELGARYDIVIAFGDTEQDIPLLESARRAVAMNPRPLLARVARERGWTALTFRHNVPARVAEILDRSFRTNTVSLSRASCWSNVASGAPSIRAR